MKDREKKAMMDRGKGKTSRSPPGQVVINNFGQSTDVFFIVLFCQLSWNSSDILIMHWACLLHIGSLVAAMTNAKKKDSRTEEECVVGHCLLPGYQKLELPNNVTHIEMDLEVPTDDHAVPARTP